MDILSIQERDKVRKAIFSKINENIKIDEVKIKHPNK
jgi:hypothetical protein